MDIMPINFDSILRQMENATIVMNDFARQFNEANAQPNTIMGLPVRIVDDDFESRFNEANSQARTEARNTYSLEGSNLEVLQRVVERLPDMRTVNYIKKVNLNDCWEDGIYQCYLDITIYDWVQPEYRQVFTDELFALHDSVTDSFTTNWKKEGF